MEVVVDRIREVVVVRPVGRLDDGTNRAFHDALVTLLDEGDRWVVIDFDRTESICAASMRVLLMVGKKTAPPAGGLILCSVNDHLHRAFEVAGLATRFSRGRSVEEAIGRLEEEQTLKRLSELAGNLLASAEAREE